MKNNKSLSKSNSAKISKLNESTESEMLKDNLQDFYHNTKEKLLILKSEIDLCKQENEKQKEENNALNMKYNLLIQYNEDLNLKLKGMKEKLIYSNKNKNNLLMQIRDLRHDVESTGREIDTMKIDTNYKVKSIQNEIDHINNVKENNIKILHKKIEGEENYQLELIRKIEEMKTEIEKYKEMMKEVGSDDVRNKELLKETAEMTKFLSEL
jgi:hypothetical protein